MGSRRRRALRSPGSSGSGKEAGAQNRSPGCARRPGARRPGAPACCCRDGWRQKTANTDLKTPSSNCTIVVALGGACSTCECKQHDYKYHRHLFLSLLASRKISSGAGNGQSSAVSSSFLIPKLARLSDPFPVHMCVIYQNNQVVHRKTRRKVPPSGCSVVCHEDLKSKTQI